MNKKLNDRDRAEEAPWFASPFRLISWMDILKFSAARFYGTAGLLAKIEEIIGSSEADEPMTDDSRKTMAHMVAEIKGQCEAINLSMSLRSVERLGKATSESITFKQLKGSFEELSTRIRDEIGDNLFLFIPKTHVRFYEGEKLFGSEVEEAFPSTAYDIREAGKCLALHRNTAAVCHLMRTLEIGLRALAKKLKIDYTNKTWNSIIEVAESRLKKARFAKRKPRNWKEDEKFYSEAIAHFRFLKDAWRNYSMHVYERYDEDQADTIFTHVRAFMRQLTKKVREAVPSAGVAGALNTLPRKRPNSI
jgi:hypothetical protein